MNEYQKFYVYQHFDVDTGDVVYIGVGRSCRAFRSCGSGHRSEEHKLWLEDKYNRGKIPVEFLAYGLTREKAFELEKKYIQELKPEFNKMHNPDHKRPSKFSKETMNLVRGLRDMGYSFVKISYLLGGNSLVARENTTAMSMRAIVNGKNE